MRILVDGDACPNINEIYQLVEHYQKEMIVYIDYAHELNNKPFLIKQAEIGHDSVDYLILEDVKENDIVITQDYGLSSLVLLKKARVLHVSGMIIDSNNIDGLLMQRYMGAKLRKQNKHLKGPKKRTQDQMTYFLNQLELLLKDV